MKTMSLVAMVLMAVLVACGDPPVNNAGLVGQMTPNPEPEPDPQPDPQPTPEPDVMPDPSILTIVGDDVLEIFFDQRAQLQVQLTTSSGEPISGAEVRFRVLGEGPQLEASSASTDGEGIVSNALFGGRADGLFEVIAEADGATAAKYTVFVFPQDEAAYRVATIAEGVPRPDAITVRLHSPDVRCDTVNAGQIPAAIETQNIDLAPGEPNVPDVVFPDLPNDTSYTVTVLATLDPNIPAAFGCVDDAPTIVGGMGVRVEVPLIEVFPRLEGTYDVVTRVDLTDALPEPWESNIRFVADVFANPARGIVNVLFGDPNDNDDGLLGDFLDDTPGRRQIAEGILVDLVTATEVGRNLERFFGTGNEAFRVVTDFAIEGAFEFDGQGMGGDLGPANRHRYDRIAVDWTVDCAPDDEECRRIEIGLDEIDGVGILTSDFSGRVDSGERLFVDRHGFDFNYGPIAIALMERVVLPRVFGVADFGDALGILVSCGGFAENLFPDNILFQFGAEEACDFALDLLADELVERLLGAGLGLPSLSLATFDENDDPTKVGCAIAEGQYDGSETFRSFANVGGEESRCAWDARFLTDNGEGIVESDFYAEQP